MKSENYWEFFVKTWDLMAGNLCVNIFLAFEVQTNNVKWGHNHQSE